jgi:rubrerythrin
MSRLPRHLEHLRTGFTAEAVAAATCRAFAEQAKEEGRANLAQRWSALAEEKDRAARELMHAAGRVGSALVNMRGALGEEQYVIEVLYPRLAEDLADMGHPEEAALLERVRVQHQRHLGLLDELRREMMGAMADVGATAVAKAG